MSPCSSSSTFGLISASTNRRTASCSISCSSLHRYMPAPRIVAPVPPASVGSPTLARLGQPTGRHRGRDPRADDGQQAEMAAVAEPAPVASPTRSRSRFPHFPALDGLKGLAVLAIVVYDLGTRWAKGGHLGADTLFVLMGFLAMASLLTSRADERGVALKSFWSRRIRRIIGPTLVVLAIAVAFGFAAANALQREHLAGDGLSALASVANWRMIQTHQAFGPATAFASPVRQFWLLAIVGQVVLVVSLLTAFLLDRLHWSRDQLGGVLAFLLVISSALCVALHQSPARVLYGTDTRAAEILVGCVLAIIIYDPRITIRLAMPGPVRDTINAAGVVAGLFLLLAWVALRPDKLVVMIGLLAVALASAAVVLACIVPEGPVASLLSLPPLRRARSHRDRAVPAALADLRLDRAAARAPPARHQAHGRAALRHLRGRGRAAVRLRTRPRPRAGELRFEPAPGPGGGTGRGRARRRGAGGGDRDRAEGQRHEGRNRGPHDHDHGRAGPGATDRGLLRRRARVDARDRGQVVGSADRQDQGRRRRRLPGLRHRPGPAGEERSRRGGGDPERVQQLGQPVGHGCDVDQARHRRRRDRHLRGGRPSQPGRAQLHRDGQLRLPVPALPADAQGGRDAGRARAPRSSG